MDRIESFLAMEGKLFEKAKAWGKKYNENQPLKATPAEVKEYNAYKKEMKEKHLPAIPFQTWLRTNRKALDPATKAEPSTHQHDDHDSAYFKTHYNCTVADIPDGKDPETTEQAIRMMRADASKWLAAIKTTSTFREDVTKICAAWKDGDPGKGEYRNLFDHGIKPTPALIASMLKVSEGVNGWEESMNLFSDDANQQFRFHFLWITDAIAEMVDYKYGEHIGACSTGDGDEGHVYYG